MCLEQHKYSKCTLKVCAGKFGLSVGSVRLPPPVIDIIQSSKSSAPESLWYVLNDRFSENLFFCFFLVPLFCCKKYSFKWILAQLNWKSKQKQKSNFIHKKNKNKFTYPRWIFFTSCEKYLLLFVCDQLSLWMYSYMLGIWVCTHSIWWWMHPNNASTSVYGCMQISVY